MMFLIGKRKVDGAGRIAIPGEVRSALEIKENDELEVHMAYTEKTILIKLILQKSGAI